VNAGFGRLAFQNPRISAFQHAQALRPSLVSTPPGFARRLVSQGFWAHAIAGLLKCSNFSVGRLDVDARRPSFWPLLSPS
jgi:hypothetical protein